MSVSVNKLFVHSNGLRMTEESEIDLKLDGKKALQYSYIDIYFALFSAF